jgi:hypothetical protein
MHDDSRFPCAFCWGCELAVRAGDENSLFALLCSRVSGEKFAVKFYAVRNAFERERLLYMDPALRPMMPATRALIGNYNGAVCGPNGYRFPPCIIIEKGESLKEWARREAQPDFITTMQVRSLLLLVLVILMARPGAPIDTSAPSGIRHFNQFNTTPFVQRPDPWTPYPIRVQLGQVLLAATHALPHPHSCLRNSCLLERHQLMSECGCMHACGAP